MAETPHTVRWGILACGWIASVFTKDLLVDPATRGVSDIAHDVVAAASASSPEKAEQFLKDCKCPPTAVAYGSYEELVADPNVDIVYVATPHSHHFQNTMLCLNAGKHVLCEKPITVNAAQARILVEIARRKGLFLMEAVWTRFFPISVKIRELVSNGTVGDVHRVLADLSFGEDVEKKWGTKHRMVNMNLAGGAMLDLGIYSLTWVFQILYHLQPEGREPPVVSSSMSKYYKTGADQLTTILLNFPSEINAHGIAMTALTVATDLEGTNSAVPAVRIQGSRGEIQVYGPIYRPTKYRIIGKGDGSSGPQVQDFEVPVPGGYGMFWEADECVRCLRDKKLESKTLSWEESVIIMDVMDKVREQNDLKYPEVIESTVYRG